MTGRHEVMPGIRTPVVARYRETGDGALRVVHIEPKGRLVVVQDAHGRQMQFELQNADRFLHLFLAAMKKAAYARPTTSDVGW